jgi:hypothetical protein
LSTITSSVSSVDESLCLSPLWRVGAVELADVEKPTPRGRPVIDRRDDFARMAEAPAYVETGRKRGSVVVRVAHDGEPYRPWPNAAAGLQEVL